MPIIKPSELFYDIESRSRADLKKQGSYKYARDKSTTTLLFQYAADDDEPVILDLARGDVIPEYVLDWLEDPDVEKIGANNMGFDNEVLEHAEGIRIPVEQCTDILQLATLYNLPGNLGGLAKALKLPEHLWKDTKGKEWIKLFSIPQPKNSKWRKAGHEFCDHTTHPEEWQAFVGYGGQDIITTRACHRAMPKWNDTDFERSVIEADYHINRRGVKVDEKYLRNVIYLTDREADRLRKEVEEITGGIRATQRDKFKTWINTKWPEAKLENTQAATFDRLLEVRKDMPEIVRRVLELSRMATATSVAKFAKMLDFMCDDGRLRGMFRYGGAGATMRWAGSGPQLQNITRGSLKQYEIDAFVSAVKLWRSAADDYLLPPNLLKAAQSCIRAAIVPSTGHSFRDGDWSSMEGRGLAWVAGEHAILDAYREGKNLYYLNAVNMFNIPYEEMSKKHPLYMVCKVTELSMGYAGGVPAFAGMAKNYRLDLEQLANGLYDEDVIPEWAYAQANRLYHNPKFQRNIRATGLDKPVWLALDSIKRMWRGGRPKTVSFWRQIDDACRAAIDNPGLVYTAGYDGMLKIDVTTDGNGSQWLRIRLPSGRYLSYMWPAISGREKKKREPVAWVAEFDQAANEWVQVPVYSEEDEGEEDDEDDNDTIVSFWAMTEAGLQKRYAHGGVWCNNVVQGLCRDLLAHKIVESEAEAWRLVMHVHDQGVSDLPNADPRRESEFQAFLCRLAPWASNPRYAMPIEADVDITRRFNKG